MKLIFNILFYFLVFNIIISCNNENITLRQSEKIVKFNNRLSQQFETGDTLNFFLDDNASLELVFIKGDTFILGYNKEQKKFERENIVVLDDYFIGKFEITQKQWYAVMKNNPSFFQGERLPVEQTSWLYVKVFIKRINNMISKYNVKGKFRLPTEAEWEYAARGGENFIYSGSDNFDEVGWTSENSDSKTHIAGTKKPNGYGLYDMSGNVWEWCGDFYVDHVLKYDTVPIFNPFCNTKSPYKVLRGGSWFYNKKYARIFIRGNDEDEWMWNDCGFRLVFSYN